MGEGHGLYGEGVGGGEVRLIFIFRITVALDPAAWGTRPGAY